MSLWDIFLHAMTLTAEFSMLLLGIKHLLLHWLHWSTALTCQDLALVAHAAKGELVIIWQKASEIPAMSTSHAALVNEAVALSAVLCNVETGTWRSLLFLLSLELLAFGERPNDWITSCAFHDRRRGSVVLAASSSSEHPQSSRGREDVPLSSIPLIVG